MTQTGSAPVECTEHGGFVASLHCPKLTRLLHDTTLERRWGTEHLSALPLPHLSVRSSPTLSSPGLCWNIQLPIIY